MIITGHGLPLTICVPRVSHGRAWQLLPLAEAAPAPAFQFTLGAGAATAWAAEPGPAGHAAAGVVLPAFPAGNTIELLRWWRFAALQPDGPERKSCGSQSPQQQLAAVLQDLDPVGTVHRNQQGPPLQGQRATLGCQLGAHQLWPATAEFCQARIPARAVTRLKSAQAAGQRFRAGVGWLPQYVDRYRNVQTG